MIHVAYVATHGFAGDVFADTIMPCDPPCDADEVEALRDQTLEKIRPDGMVRVAIITWRRLD